MSDGNMTYEDWLRGCVHHDGRHGYVTLPCDEVLKIADFIERLRADRKTENSSEKPNNCEPQTETKTETQNSNLTFEKRTMLDCYNCKRFETEDECIECLYEPKDEPQTELVNDSPILVKDLVDDEFNPYDEECMRCKHLKLKCEFVPSYCKYEPRDEPRTEDLQDWKDRMWAEAVIEPQTDCPWR